MKKHILKNKELQVTFDLTQFQISSLLYKGKEYFYQKNHKWKKSFPVLFPWVGKMNNKTYLHNDKVYHMNHHGFFCDITQWQIKKKSNKCLVLIYKGQDFIKQYPFPFWLKTEIKIKQNTLNYNIIIKNLSKTKTMPYGFGFHPGFLLDKKNTKIQLSRKCKLMQLPDHNFFTSDLTQTLVNNFNVKKYDFAKGATYLLWSSQLDVAIVTDYKNDKKFKLMFDPVLMVALWSEGNTCDYLCIEPWYSQPDYLQNAKVPLCKKPGVLFLDCKKKINYRFLMELLN